MYHRVPREEQEKGAGCQKPMNGQGGTRFQIALSCSQASTEKQNIIYKDMAWSFILASLEKRSQPEVRYRHEQDQPE
jgi:hypothetical protein